MSTETYADVEDIQKDAEEATKAELVDKKLDIRMPVKQHSGSSVESRRSSVSNVPPIKPKIVSKYKKPVFGRQEHVEEKDKNGQVRFSAIKETGTFKVKPRFQTKKKMGIRQKSSSRSRERKQRKKKKATKATEPKKDVDESSEEEPDVSEIVLSKPQVKNITVKGVLPGYFDFYRYFPKNISTFFR